MFDESKKYHKEEVVEYTCDMCGKTFHRMYKQLLKSRQTHNRTQDFCRSCSAKISISLKPQCTKDFWEADNRKEAHSLAVKSSEKYYQSLPERNKKLQGKNNGMYGKKHTTEAKLKMSKSRTGKTGEKATAWKGGKESLNKRVKRHIFRNICWGAKVLERDKHKCQCCGTSDKLDAHHIKPISLIIKELLIGKEAWTDEEKFQYLITCQEIIDESLLNGITLCRKCHKEHHISWGSHNAKGININERQQ